MTGRIRRADQTDGTASPVERDELDKACHLHMMRSSDSS